MSLVILNPLACFQNVNVYDVTDSRDENHTLAFASEYNLQQWSFSGAIVLGLNFRISTAHMDSCRNYLK